MKLYTLIMLTSALSLTTSVATAQPVKELKKALELKIPREGGANGASVAWHPGLKKYYAAMTGNESYFIGVYDAKGTRLNPTTQETMFDIRGLWYNPNTKTIQMNGFEDYGWAEYKLDSKGFPAAVKNLHEGMNQPGEQSVGIFNPKAKAIYFFNDEGDLDQYDFSNAEFEETVNLYLGKSSEAEDEDHDNYDVLEDYNTTPIFTGIPKAEIGLLNHTKREVELYDVNTGYITKKYSFPETAPVNNFLNFSYSNGTFWLFDKDKRVWIGYK